MSVPVRSSQDINKRVIISTSCRLDRVAPPVRDPSIPVEDLSEVLRFLPQPAVLRPDCADQPSWPSTHSNSVHRNRAIYGGTADCGAIPMPYNPHVRAETEFGRAYGPESLSGKFRRARCGKSGQFGNPKYRFITTDPVPKSFFAVCTALTRIVGLVDSTRVLPPARLLGCDQFERGCLGQYERSRA